MSSEGQNVRTSSEQRRQNVRTSKRRRTARGSTGRKRRKKILFQRLREKKEESSFDLDKRTKFMISQQHSMGDGYARRKCDNCGDGKSTRDADKGVLATLGTGCETRKGTAACKTSSESSSAGRGADSDDEENRKGIDGEEEEEEKTLPATHEKEEESSFDLEKRTKFMISPQHSVGDGYARRK
jgi:hypothetical protein